MSIAVAQPELAFADVEAGCTSRLPRRHEAVTIVGMDGPFKGCPRARQFAGYLPEATLQMVGEVQRITYRRSGITHWDLTDDDAATEGAGLAFSRQWTAKRVRSCFFPPMPHAMAGKWTGHSLRRCPPGARVAQTSASP